MSSARMHTLRAGFTLIEILIVVVILGILSVIIIPQFANANEDASRAVFAKNVKSFAEAMDRYYLDNGDYPEDGSSGVLPAGFDDYVIETTFEGGTTLGGVWDTELNSMGIISAIGVHFNDGSDPGDAEMNAIDAMIDDGDVTTGAFRRLAATRYYWVVAE